MADTHDATAVTALGHASGATWAFRDDQALFVAVMAKATLELVHGGLARRVAPQPVHRADIHHGNSPGRSVRATTQLGPPKPLVDVTLVGRARSPGGNPVTQLPVTLGLGMDGGPMLLQKTLEVVGDNTPQGLQAFSELPLVWERAAGGPGVSDNPLGAGTGKTPNIRNPQNPGQPAGFGPIAASWPARRKRLTPDQRKGLAATPPTLVRGFDRHYFQVAPVDQQVASLRGDEWLILEGVSASSPRLTTRLPFLVGQARIYLPSVRPAELTLRLEDLDIDADAGTVSVLFRGAFPVADASHLGRMLVVVAVAQENESTAWPAFNQGAAAAPPQAPEPALPTQHISRSKQGPAGTMLIVPEETPVSLTGTMVLDEQAPPPAAPVPAPPAPTRARFDSTVAAQEGTFDDNLPFKVAQPAPTAATSAPNLAALPFQPVPAVGMPAVGAPPPPAEPAPYVDVEVYQEISVDVDTSDFGSETAAPDEPAVVRDKKDITITVEGEGDAAPALPFAPGQAALPPALLASFPRPPWSPPEADDSPFAGTFVLSPEDHAAAAAAVGLPFFNADVQEIPVSVGQRGSATEADLLSLLPRRRSEVVPVVNVSPFGVGTLAWEARPPEPTLTVIVKGSFQLTDGAPARATEGMPDVVGDLYWGDDPKRTLRYPSDYAIFKPRADVTLVGHAHATGGQAKAMEVTLTFGEPKGEGERHFSKTLLAIGDRTWESTVGGKIPGAPKAFDKIPLVWERAFGGPSIVTNPSGVGAKAAPSADGVARLPSLEQPKARMESPSSSPTPVCFAPIPPSFPRRWARIGSYDKAWLAERWPYFPEDFDWGFFQAAPLDQQLDYLQGDEPFTLSGCLPTTPRISGRLPGVRPRAFVMREPEDGGDLHEVRLRLDTVTFDPDAGLVHLVWRGLLRVRDEGAPEVRSLLILRENLSDEPLSNEAVQQRFYAALQPELPELDALPEVPPQNDPPPPPDDPRIQEVKDTLAKAEKERDQKLAELGISLDEIEPDAPGPGKVDCAMLEDLLRKKEYTDEEIAHALRHLDPPEAPPPDPTARDQVLLRRAAGESLEAMVLADADLSELDLEGQSLKGSFLQGANLRGARLVSANLEGCQMEGVDLTGADLTSANLTLTDLSGAKLEGAKLDGACLSFAVFTKARAQGASFRGAQGERPTFTEANLTETTFEGCELASASFLEATLDRAIFNEAKLPKAVLFAAKGRDVSANRAVLTGAGAEHAELPGVSLIAIDAEGSTWERADLSHAKLTQAALKSAGFLRTKLGFARLEGADLREASLRRATLVKADLRRADLLDAELEGTDLRGADLSYSNLFGVHSWKANLEGANVEGALLGKTKLGKRA